MDKAILIYPWDIKGYVKLDNTTKRMIVKKLLTTYRFKKDICKELGVPHYWLQNYKTVDKIDTKTFKRIIDLTGDTSLVDKIKYFEDGRGASSSWYIGNFPIHYSPLWHFIISLSIGDGHVSKSKKEAFSWYQKQAGLHKLIPLVKRLGFIYKPKTISSKKDYIILPNLIWKVGKFVMSVKTKEELKTKILARSKELGKEYELAFLIAFFSDEGGINKNDFTLHQEGDLEFLSRVSLFLDSLGIEHTRNKKSNSKWNIRFRNRALPKIAELFKSLEPHGITLLHRQNKFNKLIAYRKSLARY